MAQLPSLLVNAVTTFDGKALAKGQKTVGSFAKNVAKSLGLAFGTTAVIAFGKASVKAFAEDEKAATRLARTVDNLGLGFENTRITKFISDLEKTAAVSDDVLRPAFTSLLTTTGSVEKSQKLLALALDISAGSGEDAATVANDLSNAYVGNTKGLAKYRLGLTKAELAGKSFNEIQDLLNKQFSGQNTDRLNTYAGKMEALAVASDNAKEIIGKGLVDALSMLGENDSVSNLADDMESVALYIGDAIRGVGVLVEYLKSIPGAGILFDAFKLGFKSTPLGLLNELGRANRVAPKPFSTPMTVSGATDSGAKDAKARAAAEAAAAKRQKELLALQKKSAIAEKNKLALTKAAAVFDTTRISLAAALQATYDKETRLRLEALIAIENEQGDLALKKINELANFQKSADLQKLAGITTIGDAALQELNNRLINELRVINSSKMAEEDKELAREEAFKKYNAALVAAGGLAEKNSYDERTQIQLTEVARLASLSKTYNASLTLDKIRESEEINMIDRVAKAQKAADDARLKALQEYINLLGKVGTGGSAGGGGGGGGSNTPGTPSGPAATIESVKKKEADDAAKYFADTVTDTFQSVEDSGAFNALVKSFMGGAIGSFNAGSFKATEGGSVFNSGAVGAFDRDINIKIETGIGDPEAIARAVADVLNQSTYRGTSTNRDTGIYIQ